MDEAARLGSASVYEARHSWLDHPIIAEHYRQRGLIDGLRWQEWVTKYLGGPAERSLELGCASGALSFFLFENHLSRSIDGVDAGEDQIAAAEESREICRAPGAFRVGDLNSHVLPRTTYDLVFVSHRMHHVAGLERLLDQVYASLTPRGVFVIEGYVGPSRFQWTEAQIELVKMAMSWLPDRLRMLRWAVPKTHEGRPDRTAVAQASVFEAIRSAEIRPLFQQRFRPVAMRPLGGTLQHLLYNGIVHNFAETEPEARQYLHVVAQLEDTLVDTGLVPSDFMLMIGGRR